MFAAAAHTIPVLDNQWVADLLTGVIVTLFLALVAWGLKIKKMLDRLSTEVKPNGGDTLSSGDTISRIESKVDVIMVNVATQKGHTDAVEREVFTRLEKLETRKQVEARVAKEHE